jgi:hypothetical protein
MKLGWSLIAAMTSTKALVPGTKFTDFQYDLKVWPGIGAKYTGVRSSSKAKCLNVKALRLWHFHKICQAGSIDRYSAERRYS